MISPGQLIAALNTHPNWWVTDRADCCICFADRDGPHAADCPIPAILAYKPTDPAPYGYVNIPHIPITSPVVVIDQGNGKTRIIKASDLGTDA